MPFLALKQIQSMQSIKQLKIKCKLSIDAWDDLIGQIYHQRMDLHSEEAWTNENAKNRTKKIDFVLKIRSFIFFVIFDRIND